MPSQNIPAAILAKAISLVLLPSFLPVYLVFFAVPVPAGFPWLHFGSVLLIAIAPLAVSVLYWKLIGEKEMFVIAREKRTVPFLFGMTGLGLFILLHHFKDDGSLPSIWLWSFAATVVAGFTITLFWKISLHLMGIGGMLALGLQTGWLQTHLWALILAVSLTGLCIWARMFLKSHGWAQILMGFVMGFLVSWVVLQLN